MEVSQQNHFNYTHNHAGFLSSYRNVSKPQNVQLLLIQRIVSSLKKHGCTSLEQAWKIYNLYVKHTYLHRDMETREQDRTLLMWMTKEGKAKIVQKPLKMGADITLKTRDRDGWTACICSVQNIYKKIVQTFIKVDTNLEDRNNEGTTALIWTTTHGNHATQALIKAHTHIEIGDNNGDTALMEAAWKGHEEVMCLLIKAGANLEATNKAGTTALMWATQKGRENAVHILIQAGANLNTRNNKGETALMWATGNGQEKTVQILVEAGANPNLCDNEGETALMWAAGRGYEKMIQILIKAGAHPNICDKKGQTALIYAVLSQHEKVVQLLLKAGASLKARSQYGNSPLMLASLLGDEKTVQTLIKAHSKLEIRNQYGSTALMLAAEVGYEKIVSLLIEAGANLETRDLDDYTALTRTLYFKPNMATLLQKLGADLKFAKKFITVKFLAHAWGMKGQSQLIDKKNNPITFELQGLKEFTTAHILSTYVVKFFASNAWIKKTLSKECQENICTCITNILPHSSESHAKTLSKILSGKPVMILGGFNGNPSGHTIGMVIGKNRPDQYRLIVCNRGHGKMADETTTFYSIAPSNITEELLNNLTKNYPDLQAFNQMLAGLNLIRIDGFKQKDQRVGNCSLASSKAAFRVVCEWYTNRAMACGIYKKFTETFMREQALIDYFEDYIEPEASHELDVPLLQAIRAKYEQKPGMLLSTDMLEKFKALRSLLVWTVVEGQARMVRKPLSMNADFKVSDHDDGTALFWAVQNGYGDIVQTFIKDGVNLEVHDQEGGTALVCAAANGHDKTVQALIQAGANLETRNSGGNTALMFACMNGHEKVVQTLLKAHANLETGDGAEECGTALMWAAWKGQEKVLQLLIEAKANLEACTNNGTALICAAANGHEKAVQLLLMTGANPTARNGINMTALICAASRGHEKVVHMLIKDKVNVNFEACTNLGNTALICAAGNGHEKVVHMLIEAGANPGTCNHEGKTALMCATEYGREKVVHMLTKDKVC